MCDTKAKMENYSNNVQNVKIKQVIKLKYAYAHYSEQVLVWFLFIWIAILDKVSNWFYFYRPVPI